MSEMADPGSQGGGNKRDFGDSDRSWNDENSGGSCVDPQDLSAKRARVSGSEDGVQETGGGENLGGSGGGVEEGDLGREPMAVDEDLEENRAEEREELPGPEQAEAENEGGENNMDGVAAEGSGMRLPEPVGLNAEAYRATMVPGNSELQGFNQSRENTEPTTTPFSKAMETIKERKLMAEKKYRPLITWEPLAQNDDIPRRLVTALEDGCVDFLAKNIDAIVSLENIPYALRHKISRASCRARTMNAHSVELLLKGYPTEIRLDDCSWMTKEQFTNLFNSCDTRKLIVLQLDLCGQCMTLRTLQGPTALPFLPALTTLSLRGACQLSDEGIDLLVRSAPALLSLNLGQCPLLTHSAINLVANKLAHTLKELFIDDCQNINAMLVLPTLKRFKCLEVLSVAGIETVSDDFISETVTSLGSTMKELVLAYCCKITDDSLEAIGRNCPSLSAIDLSDLGLLTDSALQYLANGCQSIQTLRLLGNNFSDETIAAFLEASGKPIKHLSLNQCSKVGDDTALSISKRGKRLLTLDLSWCHNLKEEAFGLIVDKCSSLSLLKVFGCKQITNRFLHGHSNANVRIIGLSVPSKILEQLDPIEPEGALRHSSVTYPDS